MNGRLRDPLVGRDVFVGVLMGLVIKSGQMTDHLLERALGAPPFSGLQIHLTLGRSLAWLAEGWSISLS